MTYCWCGCRPGNRPPRRASSPTRCPGSYPTPASSGARSASSCSRDHRTSTGRDSPAASGRAPPSCARSGKRSPGPWATGQAVAKPARGSYRRSMLAWRRVWLVGPAGRLRAPAQVATECGEEDGGVLLTAHRFGQVVSYARLLCRHLAVRARPWAAESELAIAREPGLLRLARRSGCRALVLGPEPDPLVREAREPGALRAAARALRRIRHAGLLTVAHLTLGREGDDAGVFARAVWLTTAGRVAFPRLTAQEGAGPMSPDELGRGLAWAARMLHRHRAIWRRTGIVGADGRAALIANYRLRRALTHFLEEHASRLGELRGQLAFRNLRPALTALRRNLHGMVPNGALLEQALEETS